MNKPKNFISLVLALALASCVTQTTTAKTSAEAGAFCLDLYEVSHSIMQARQHGVPLKQSLAVLNAESDSNKHVEMNRVLNAVVVDAYKVPLFQTEQNKQVAAEEFAVNIYVSCIDITSSSKAAPTKTTIHF